jgi:hypothetical protein
VGVRLKKSLNNEFFHNNFVDNKKQLGFDEFSKSFWDAGYPFGGNFWSDYRGIDSDKDGIGDTPYLVNGDEADRFPLMGKTYEFSAFRDQTVKQTVKIISDVFISNFNFNERGILEFLVKAESETLGFCRVSVPKTLLNVSDVSDWIVNLDNDILELNIFEDEEFTYLYFQFTASENMQIIQIMTREETLDPFFAFLALLICIGIVVVLASWKVRLKSDMLKFSST